MNNLKNKNIFINFDYLRNNLTMKNILAFYGKRIIDLFTHIPLMINKHKVIYELKTEDIGIEVTLDIIVKKYQKNFIKKAPFKVICENNKKQPIEILFFNMNEFQIKNYLKLESSYRISGKLNLVSNKFQIIHPSNILKESEWIYFDNFEPQYNLARKGINKKIFRRIIKDNLTSIKSFKYPNEWIDKKFKKYYWNSFKDSLIQIHFPESENKILKIESHRERLAFDELLSSYLTFHELKKKIRSKHKINRILNFNLSLNLQNKLPFNLTEDQIKSLNEIQSDLKRNVQMYRLLQGDVGSGKTIIALLAIADVVNSGYQAVLMAPTEILAKQHYEYFNKIFSKLNINVEIITGKTKKKKEIYKKLFKSEINILIGTHSVYNSSIKFNKLGLIVIDEQHKFGVKQRINLLEKSVGCHTLIMSATPIPRSLSFAMYGEISTSNIKTKPIGRKDVITSIISIDQINKLLDGIERKLKKKEQVFWILPTIDNLDSDKHTLTTRYEFLQTKFKDKVSCVHGKMRKEDIDQVMQNFKDKKIMLLVATTVVEVGINIPDATLMIIENAERFGLSQLHQLRGRVMRGNLNSNCVLIHNKNLSDITKERLLILKNNNNGFEIAEKDLYLRGAGDFFGTNQSGLPTWKFFEPRLDYKLLDSVKKNSEMLLENYNLNKDKISFLQEVFYSERNFKNYFSV